MDVEALTEQPPVQALPLPAVHWNGRPFELPPQRVRHHPILVHVVEGGSDGAAGGLVGHTEGSHLAQDPGAPSAMDGDAVTCACARGSRVVDQPARREATDRFSDRVVRESLAEEPFAELRRRQLAPAEENEAGGGCSCGTGVSGDAGLAWPHIAW
jgi:hypothetical protein